MGAPSTTTRADDDDDDDLKKPEAFPTNNDSGAQAYLSLIQQYLSVFMVDNATFLADRCVAEYPQCSQAVYLLALCHYRAGKPQTARHILIRYRSAPPVHNKQQENIHSTGEDSSTTSSMHYLSAQCSYELKEYSRAEDALLRETRAAYKQQPSSRDAMPTLAMDDWILQTSVRISCYGSSVMS
jgi:hypothetical protein